jgi:hypothetical protein
MVWGKRCVGRIVSALKCGIGLGKVSCQLPTCMWCRWMRVPGLISGVVGARRGFEMYLCSATSGLLSVAMVNSKQIGTNTILQLLNLLPEHIQKYYYIVATTATCSLASSHITYLPRTQPQQSSRTPSASPPTTHTPDQQTASPHYGSYPSSASRLKRCCLIDVISGALLLSTCTYPYPSVVSCPLTYLSIFSQSGRRRSWAKVGADNARNAS